MHRLSIKPINGLICASALKGAVERLRSAALAAGFAPGYLCRALHIRGSFHIRGSVHVRGRVGPRRRGDFYRVLRYLNGVVPALEYCVFTLNTHRDVAGLYALALEPLDGASPIGGAHSVRGVDLELGHRVDGAPQALSQVLDTVKGNSAQFQATAQRPGAGVD